MARQYAELQTAMVAPPPSKSERFAGHDGSATASAVFDEGECDSPAFDGWTKKPIYRRKEKKEDDAEMDEANDELR